MSLNQESDNDSKILDLNLVNEAEKYLIETKIINETPIISDFGGIFNLSNHVNLFLKLENMQTNGSFKIRGLVNQFRDLNNNTNSQSSSKLVTFSAGNYGKAFSFLCSKLNIKAKVLLPQSAAESRVQYIISRGLETERYASGELLVKGVEDHVKNGWTLMHPFDDIKLIAGYAPIAREILKFVDPDIVLVCCGSGALLAGVSAGFALDGSKAVIYGVEPETADTMKESFEKGYPVKKFTSHSIATGLAPPMAGTIAYKVCKKYVNGIILVSDQEIKETCKILFEKGLKVEPSGCAAMAAILFNKVPNVNTTTMTTNTSNDSNKIETKLKIVAILSGGNVSADELVNIFQ